MCENVCTGLHLEAEATTQELTRDLRRGLKAVDRRYNCALPALDAMRRFGGGWILTALVLLILWMAACDAGFNRPLLAKANVDDAGRCRADNLHDVEIAIHRAKLQQR